MPQVRIGGAAAHFGAAHVVAQILMLGYSGFFYRTCETRPTATRIVFVGRAEQRLATDHIHINARLEQMVVCVAEGMLRAAFLRYLVLRGSEGDAHEVEKWDGRIELR